MTECNGQVFAVFSRSSYSLWKLPLEMAVIGVLVRNLSRGAENRKDVDTSHPQSKAVSIGGAEIKEEAGDQLLPGRRRVAPAHWIYRKCDSLGMEIKSVSRTRSYCKNRGNTGRSEWCGCILRCSKGHRRPVLIARHKSAKMDWFSVLSLSLSLFVCVFVCVVKNTFNYY